MSKGLRWFVMFTFSILDIMALGQAMSSPVNRSWFMWMFLIIMITHGCIIYGFTRIEPRDKYHG